MQIRPARPDDAGALRDIVERAYSRYIERIGRRPAPMDDDYVAKIGDGHVEVAVEGGNPVGLIVLVPQADHLLVENVAVDPAFQRGGVGRALLAHAEQRAAQRGLREIRLYTNAAMTENLSLYPRLGYRETGRDTEHGFQRVYFSKVSPPRGARPP
ncbi:MAG: GNAT family N-acetyltransferase [Actinobacteria bacterium]|nr:MAG: GNAT family N-acetyltransferase [Actinomycetota bacterium]